MRNHRMAVSVVILGLLWIGVLGCSRRPNDEESSVNLYIR